MDDLAFELVTVLARIGREDRELYRELRAEAWAMVAAKHERQTEEEREIWLATAS